MTSSSIPQHDDSKLQDILGIIGIQPVVSMSSCRAPRHSSGGRFTRDIIKDRASSVRLRHGGDSSLCASRGVCLLLLYEHWLVRPDDLSRVNKAFFQVNALISIGLLLIAALDIWWATLGRQLISPGA